MGSACLFFAISPQRALLSDINSALVQTFLTIQRMPSEVHKSLCRFPREKKTYLRLREESNRHVSAVYDAARFLYLNRFCFNGLFRTNLSGKFNVPYASSRTGNLPSLEELVVAAQALKAAEITAGDFQDTLNEVRRHDFVYLDPPYAVTSRRVFREYAPGSFSTEDLIRLGHSLDGIDERGAKFVVSYALCNEALRVFSKWRCRRVQVQRNIAGFAHHRRRAIELIVTNV
jgi:DNA adenine methylase